MSIDPMTDVKNVLLSTALDAAGVPNYEDYAKQNGKDSSGPAPKWAQTMWEYEQTPNRVFQPGHNNDMPKPLNVGASMMIKPVVLQISGWLESKKIVEFYSLQWFGPDSAKLDFQQKYNGVRGVTVHPLYDLGRYA